MNHTLYIYVVVQSHVLVWYYTVVDSIILHLILDCDKNLQMVLDFTKEKI